MPWCPRCGDEYRDGFTICSDCKIDLVEKLEEKQIIEDDFILLTRSKDSIHAHIIQSILNENNIPFSSNARTHVDLIMGDSTAGIKIFVLSRFLNEAQELIKDIDTEEISTEKNINDDHSYTLNEKKKIKSRTWVLLWIFYIPGLIAVILIILSALFSLVIN